VRKKTGGEPILPVDRVPRRETRRLGWAPGEKMTKQEGDSLKKKKRKEEDHRVTDIWGGRRQKDVDGGESFSPSGWRPIRNAHLLPPGKQPGWHSPTGLVSDKLKASKEKQVRRNLLHRRHWEKITLGDRWSKARRPAGTKLGTKVSMGGGGACTAFKGGGVWSGEILSEEVPGEKLRKTGHLGTT